jgi:hypothetical protein
MIVLNTETQKRLGRTIRGAPMSTLTRTFARITTTALIAGALAAAATPAFADTPAQTSFRTVAAVTLLPADTGNKDFQNGIRKGTQDGSKDGFADAKRNCQQAPKALNKNKALVPSPFDDGYVQGYAIGYDKGFTSGEKQFCQKAKGQGGQNKPAGNKQVAGVFEATGADPTADSVVTDRPGKTTDEFNQALPFRRNFTAPADADLLQVVVTGRGQVGCKITFGGKVVAQESGEFTAHCIFQKKV